MASYTLVAGDEVDVSDTSDRKIDGSPGDDDDDDGDRNLVSPCSSALVSRDAISFQRVDSIESREREQRAPHVIDHPPDTSRMSNKHAISISSYISSTEQQASLL